MSNHISRISYKEIVDSDYQLTDLLLRDHYLGFTEVELKHYIDNCEIARIVYAEKFSKLAKAVAGEVTSTGSASNE